MLGTSTKFLHYFIGMLPTLSVLWMVLFNLIGLSLFLSIRNGLWMLFFFPTDLYHHSCFPSLMKSGRGSSPTATAGGGLTAWPFCFGRAMSRG